MKINKKVSLTDIKITINLDEVIQRAKENTDKAILSALKAKKIATKKKTNAEDAIDNKYLSAFRDKFAKYELEDKKEIFYSLKNSIGSCILYKAIESINKNNINKATLKLIYDFAGYDSGLNLPCIDPNKSATGFAIFYNQKLSINDQLSNLDKISNNNNIVNGDDRCRFFQKDNNDCKTTKYHKGASLLEDSRKSFAEIIYRSSTGIQSLDLEDNGSYLLRDSSRNLHNTANIHNQVTRYTEDQIKSVAKIICDDTDLDSESYLAYYDIICPFVKGTLDPSDLGDNEQFFTEVISDLTFDHCASEMGSYFSSTQFLLINY